MATDVEAAGIPLDLAIPDDWGPEQVAPVVEFLELLLQALDRQYGLSILQLRHDQRQDCLDTHPARTGQNFRNPRTGPDDPDLPF